MKRGLSFKALLTMLAVVVLVADSTRLTNASQVTAADAPRADRSWRSWWTIAKRAGAAFNEDRIMAEAAAVTFYVMLALFPAIASLISLYGLVADTGTIAGQMRTLYFIMPSGGADIIQAEVTALTATGSQALSLGVFVGMATSLWSANAGIKSVFDALNVVFHERETRSYLRLTSISLMFTLGMLAFVAAALTAVVVVPVVFSFVGLEDQTKILIKVMRWPVLLVAATFCLSLLFRFGPDLHGVSWRWISPGSVAASLVWVATSLAFSYYVANFGSYNRTYGSLGAAVGFMTWIWISAMVVLMGAELNAVIANRK
jgi:membrane protein